MASRAPVRKPEASTTTHRFARSRHHLGPEVATTPALLLRRHLSAALRARVTTASARARPPPHHRLRRRPTCHRNLARRRHRRRRRRRPRRRRCLSVSSVARPTQGASRSITTAFGALSATTCGTSTMRMSSAGASASAPPLPRSAIAAHSGAALDRSGWTMWHARDRRQGWKTAVTADGEATTALTARTLPSFAPPSAAHRRRRRRRRPRRRRRRRRRHPARRRRPAHRRCRPRRRPRHRLHHLPRSRMFSSSSNSCARSSTLV